MRLGVSMGVVAKALSVLVAAINAMTTETGTVLTTESGLPLTW